MESRGPIAAELRATLDVDREFIRADGTVVAQTFCVDRGDFERCCDAIDAVHAGLERENAELRERITTQKQTIQAYRDESREWREVAYHAQAENAKLREACAELLKMAERHDPEWLHWPEMHKELRELGVEVN